MKNHRKYRWFFTSNGKLVVGGKNAEQNEEILRSIKKSGKEHYVMHTSHPGSPFSVIFSEANKVTKKDIEECAIFTGCFSRAWREGRKKTKVHIFKSTQLYKTGEMKTGTWGVKGEIKEAEVELELAFTKQEGVLRAVPYVNLKKKDIFLKISPGETDKTKMIEKLRIELEENISLEEILNALPAGGVKIIR